jgi:hypothetical protein
MNVGLICQANDGLGASLELGAALQTAGAAVTLFTTAAPSSAHVRSVPVIPLAPLEAACSELLAGLDAVGVFLNGSEAAAFRQVHSHAAHLRQQQPRPLFSGPIRPLYGDALAADLLPRLGFDLLILQGQAQRDELAWLLHGSTHQSQKHELIGLWCLPTQPIGFSVSAEPVVVVLDQQTIPPSPFAKGVLYQRLRTVAQENPHWQVHVQPDGALCPELGDDSSNDRSETSLAWHHRQDGQPPANLQVGQTDDLPMALIQASACLGIASDWLLTAMVWGKPTAVLGDYGIRTDFNGPLFFGSGAMHRLADCSPLDRLLELPRPNSDWLAARGWAISDGPQRLLRRLEELAR